jgi:hypothetical protein
MIELEYRCDQADDALEPRGDGAYCHLCKEVVVDLSRLPKKRALAIVAEGKRCVQFQVDPRTGEPVFRASPSRFGPLGAAAALGMLAACSDPASSTTVLPEPPVQLAGALPAAPAAPPAPLAPPSTTPTQVPAPSATATEGEAAQGEAAPGEAAPGEAAQGEAAQGEAAQGSEADCEDEADTASPVAAEPSDEVRVLRGRPRPPPVRPPRGTVIYDEF